MSEPRWETQERGIAGWVAPMGSELVLGNRGAIVQLFRPNERENVLIQLGVQANIVVTRILVYGWYEPPTETQPMSVKDGKNAEQVATERREHEEGIERRRWAELYHTYERCVEMAYAIWGDRVNLAQALQQNLAEEMRDRGTSAVETATPSCRSVSACASSSRSCTSDTTWTSARTASCLTMWNARMRSPRLGANGSRCVRTRTFIRGTPRTDRLC